MNVVVAGDYAEASRLAADWIEARLRAGNSVRLLLATGNTPMQTYAELAQRHRERRLPLDESWVLQLDEYAGISPADRRSLYGWMRRAVIDPLGIEEDRVVRLDGDAEDLDEVCRKYEAAVQQMGGITTSVLGLGPNGHLGFNEPPAHPDSPTRVVELTLESIESNARYWGGRDEVPRQALTAGMRLLLGAEETLLLVSGAHKREILRRTLREPCNPEVPASFLHMARNVTVLADRAAWPSDT